MLKASVIGIVFVASLFAPQAALAYGRSAPTPNLFAAWGETADNGQAAATRPQPAPRYGRNWRHGAARGWAAAPRRWRSYRAASWRPLRRALPNPPTWGGATPAPATGRDGAATLTASFGGGSVAAEASHWIGSGKFTGLPGPWCADAVNVWLRRSGHRPLDGRMASAALAYGPRLEAPEVGALAVLGSRLGWAYHVGVVAGVEPDGSIRMISGNWGRRVAEAVIPRQSVAAFVSVR